MDDLSKEVVKTATELALRPLARIIEDGVGALGGDRLREFRDERAERRRVRRTKLGQKTMAVLTHRGVEHPAEPTETSVEEILIAAQDENRAELQELWAKLLAAMLDPARSKHFRNEFIEIAKQLEPFDAAVLPELTEQGPTPPSRMRFIAGRLRSTDDAVAVSFRNLERLGLTEHVNNPPNPNITALGRQFLAAIAE